MGLFYPIIYKIDMDTYVWVIAESMIWGKISRRGGGGGDFLPKLKCPEIIDDIPVIDSNWYYICAPPCNKGDFFKIQIELWIIHVHLFPFNLYEYLYTHHKKGSLRILFKTVHMLGKLFREFHFLTELFGRRLIAKC